MQGPENVFRTDKSCALFMEEQRNFGQETDRKPAMAGFATAIVSVR